MDWVRKAVTCLAFVVLIGGMAAVVSPRAANAVSSIFVQVTNTNSNPVPVTVVNPPATQPITGNVEITGLPPVQLAPGSQVGLSPNTTRTPIIIAPTVTPLVAMFCAGISGCSFPDTFMVPAGQLFTIENISALCSGLANPTAYNIGVQATVGGNTVSHIYPIGPGSPQLGFTGGVSQDTKFYADPGSTITVLTDFEFVGVPGTCNVFLTGTLTAH